MGVLHTFGDAVRNVLGDGVESRTVECKSCGHVFTTAKTPDRAECGFCESTDLQDPRG